MIDVKLINAVSITATAALHDGYRRGHVMGWIRGNGHLAAIYTHTSIDLGHRTTTIKSVKWYTIARTHGGG